MRFPLRPVFFALSVVGVCGLRGSDVSDSDWRNLDPLEEMDSIENEMDNSNPPLQLPENGDIDESFDHISFEDNSSTSTSPQSSPSTSSTPRFFPSPLFGAPEEPSLEPVQPRRMEIVEQPRAQGFFTRFLQSENKGLLFFTLLLGVLGLAELGVFLYRWREYVRKMEELHVRPVLDPVWVAEEEEV